MLFEKILAAPTAKIANRVADENEEVVILEDAL
jgi:hypothetical protein